MEKKHKVTKDILKQILVVLYEKDFDLLKVYIYVIFAALVTLLCPLWMKSFSQLISGLREPSRKRAFIILLISLIGLFIFGLFMDVKFFALIFIFALILSGLWLSLSYYQNGQETLLQYITRCFSRFKGNNNFNNGNNSGDNNV